MTPERFPQLSHRRLSKLLSIGTSIFACSFCAIDLTGYWGGRTGQKLSLLILPVEIPFILIVLLLTIPLVGLALFGFAKRTLGLPLLTLLVVFGGWNIRPLVFRPSPFLHGFRTFVYENVPMEKLHEIAVQASQIKHSEEEIKKITSNTEVDLENERGLVFLPELKQQTAFAQLVERAYVDRQEDHLELIWGGALGGHWGIRIYFQGKPKREPGDAIYWESEPGIVFFEDTY
jgi:hypothetical protein